MTPIPGILSFPLLLLLPAPGPGAQEILPPSELVKIGRKSHMRYFRIGPSKDAKEPQGGFGLLVILPGGPGTADFNPFCRRILARACDRSFVAVQPVAVKWTEDQRIVWPTKKNPARKMKFSTEDFVEAVIADARKWKKIDPKKILLLSWSSSGPAAYAMGLSRKTSIKGFFVAMSVFKPRFLPPLKQAKGRSFYLYHSREDRICPFRMAGEAKKELLKGGAKVELQSYGGGHGWRGNIFGSIRNGLHWLSKASAPSTGKKGGKETGK